MTTSPTPPQALACEACGRWPHASRGRLTAVKLTAVFPVELLLHAVVLYFHPSYLVSVALLAVSTTLLAIWVIEPSVMRALQGWLHAPVLRARDALHAADNLWRVRVTLPDEPEALGAVVASLGALGVDVLDVEEHVLSRGVRDELVVSAPDSVSENDLARAVAAAGGRNGHVWPTTALALVDSPTKALSLAARVAEDPDELPHAAADLLGARTVTGSTAAAGSPRHGSGTTTLRLPYPEGDFLVLTRPDEVFTPAEAARAYRLAQIAEIAELSRPPA